MVDLRDRALIGLMVYTFARVNAVLSMRVEDYFEQGLPPASPGDAKGPLFRTAVVRAATS